MLELSARTRRGALQRMAAEGVDVLVIGGGITGAGIALDAAARGFRVGLVEARDFASGTSSRSTKLVHGGIRYLPQGNVSLVREALHERATLRPPVPNLPFIGAEVVYATRHEMALSLSDLLVLRMRIVLLDADHGMGCAARAPRSWPVNWDGAPVRLPHRLRRTRRPWRESWRRCFRKAPSLKTVPPQFRLP